MANLKCALVSESASLDYIEASNGNGYSVSSWDQSRNPAILEVFLLSEKLSAYQKLSLWHLTHFLNTVNSFHWILDWKPIYLKFNLELFQSNGRKRLDPTYRRSTTFALLSRQKLTALSSSEALPCSFAPFTDITRVHLNDSSNWRKLKSKRQRYFSHTEQEEEPLELCFHCCDGISGPFLR